MKAGPAIRPDVALSAWRLHRRRGLQALLWASLAGVGGCGFRLRGAGEFAFQSIALRGFLAGSSLARELRRQLAAQLTVVEDPARADVVLVAERDLRDRTVTGLTSSGLVRDMQLRVRFRFRLLGREGQVLGAPVELVLNRDMSTRESAALAKAREEDDIFRVMEADVVSQVMRRLQALTPANLRSGGA